MRKRRGSRYWALPGQSSGHLPPCAKAKLGGSEQDIPLFFVWSVHFQLPHPSPNEEAAQDPAEWDVFGVRQVCVGGAFTAHTILSF